MEKAELEVQTCSLVFNFVLLNFKSKKDVGLIVTQLCDENQKLRDCIGQLQ